MDDTRKTDIEDSDLTLIEHPGAGGVISHPTALSGPKGELTVSDSIPAISDLDMMSMGVSDETEQAMRGGRDIAKELSLNNISKSLVEKINAAIVVAEKEGAPEDKIERLRQSKRQFEAVSTLGPLRDHIVARGSKYDKMNDVQKARRLKSLTSKATKKLKDDKENRYLPVHTSCRHLKGSLPKGREHYADEFIERFSDFICRRKLKEWAVFISQTLNNLHRLRKPFPTNGDFVQLVIDVIEGNETSE